MHPRWTLPLFLAVMVNLSGCAGMAESINDAMINLTDMFGADDNAEPPNPLHPINAELTPKLLWKQKISTEQSSHGVTLVPVVSQGKVIIADRGGLVQAFDTASGDKIWASETGLPISGGPGVSDHHVIFGTTDADVVALHLEDGSIDWHARVSSEVLAIPRADQGILVIRTIDGRITALGESDGKELWAYERSVPALSLRGTSSPVIVNDMVINGYANGKVVALELSSGQLKWETSVAIPRGRSELERLIDIDADPLVVDSFIYVTSFQSGISMLTLQDGDILWRREEVSSFAGIGADWLYLYLTDENSDIWQLDQRNGGALWKQGVLHQRRLTSPVIYDDYVVVGDFEGYLHWLGRDDGRLVGRLRVAEEAIEAAPVVVADVLYVYAVDGTVAAIQAKE